MADYTHIETQLLQRLTSSHINAMSSWVGRLAPESLRHLLVADGAFISGVIDGLLVTSQAGTMNLQVGGGLGLYYDSTVELPDPAHRWIEVQDASPITVTVEAADAAQPRWDVVEIAPGVADGPGQVLDFYNEATGQFVAAPSSPLKVCTPTVTIRKGTPSATPKFPAGIDGVIPLAYVYVPAAAVLILSTDILYCRPILKPMPEEVGPGPHYADGIGRTQRVHGGGVSVATAGLSATVTNTMSGYFSRSGQRFVLPAGTGIRFSANNYDGGLPGASNTTHFYAVPPSAVFPSGYNAYIAEREFVLQTASRIASGGYATDQYHCFVVSSAKAPAISQRGQPATSSTFEVSHPTMGVLSISTDKAVYIGCVYYNFGGLQMIAQVTTGKKVAPERTSGTSITASLPIAADTLFSMTTNTVLDSAYVLPTHIRNVRILGFHRVDVQGDITVFFKDAMSSHTHLKKGTIYRSNTMDNLSYGYDFWVVLNDSQELTVNYADGNGLSATNLIRIIEWEDSVLALR